MRVRARVWVWAGLAGLASASLGWALTDHLERDNDFCTSCHLTPEVPLHIDIRRDFDSRPAASLGGLHRSRPLEGREDAAFRCIDCHGGVSLAGRFRVKALAAKDAFWYVVGRFEEPEGMRWPLWEEDCSQCHARFDESQAESWSTPRFHQLPVHNVDLGVGCVACHAVHESGGDSDAWFLHSGRVRAQCALCHVEFGEGGG